MKKEKFIGILLLLFGFVLILNASMISITGNIIFTNTEAKVSSILGLIFIALGLTIFFAEKEGGLEKSIEKEPEIIKSKTFRKSLRKHKNQLAAIDNTIKKIGTGLGKEHPLKGYKNKYAIKTSKGGRIIFNKEYGNIILDRYISDHDYRVLYA